MRKFKLYGNSTGAYIDFSNDNNFLTNPQNLGITLKNTYQRLGNKNIKTDEEFTFKNFLANIEFSSYARYTEFINFISANKNSGFKLYYAPYTANEIYCECDFTEISKEELNIFGKLNSKFSVQFKSYWLFDVTKNSNFEEDTTLGKEYILDEEETNSLFAYAYTYTEDSEEEVDSLFKYNYRYNISGQNTVVLNNTGSVETPLKIVLNGVATNPTFALYDVNDNLLQNASFEVTVASGEKFVVDSDEENMKVVLINTANEEIDKTITQDYSKTTYITLPVGEHTLIISDDNDVQITGYVEYKLQYLGV